MAEVHGEYSWNNAGEVASGSYTLFGILAGVRGSLPPIDAPRGIDEGATPEFKAFAGIYGTDGHSRSYITLDELQDYYKSPPCDTAENIRYAQAAIIPMLQELEEIMVNKSTTPDRVRVCFFFDN